MIAPARVAAYQILSAISAGRLDLPSALAQARPGLKTDRDRALAAEIATGVQRWRGLLDHLIAEFSKRRLDRLDPEVLEILRLSAYQLLYLTRVPASAVVDDAVDLAGREGKRSAAGFVNAILRTISRQRSALPLPPRPTDPANREAILDYLSITLSHPRWLAARWLDRFGLETAERWLLFNNAPARLTLRANRLRVDPTLLIQRLAEHEIQARPGLFAPDSLTVEEGHPLSDPLAAEGLFAVQDEASQLVAMLAGEHPGPLVFDACAAPGGKTTAIAAAAGPTHRIVASDLRGRRVDLLRKTVTQMGAHNVRLVQLDILTTPPFKVPFDCVLLDAPCSGLGTLRRDPDIRWKRQEADLPVFAAAQLQMLRNAAGAVREGGRLIYATCSSEPEENEQVVDAFLQSTADFTALDASRSHPRLPAEVIDVRGHLCTQPGRHGLEAFFGAVFERHKL